MVYLDYSATTPINKEVLDSYNRATLEYFANANSLHSLGGKSLNLFNNATKQISELLNVIDKEIIFTSGATEANNLALKGVALQYQNRGKHIIVSKLEHPSIYAICDYLETIGYEITRVKNDIDGLIDLEDLKKQIRKDTILISIAAVNSELGIRQPLKTINQIIKKINPNVLIHSDITQAIGKVSISLNDVDLASMSAHKIYGPKGIGLLYKKEKISLVPLIHGSSKLDDLRPGTIPLPLIVAFSKALRISLIDINKNEEIVKKLNDKICNQISNYEDVLINKTKYSIPHILNLTLPSVRPETFIHAMEKHEVYIGTNTACASGDLSQGVMALYNDNKRALSSIRISISHLTTDKDVETFLNCFEVEYNKLKDMKA